MARIEKTIDVDVPRSVAYAQWTQFEEFPRFMEDVVEVEQLDDRRLLWRTNVGGKAQEWEAEITYQEPEDRIGWRSTQGAKNSGTVWFETLGATSCRIRLEMSYEPEGLAENVGDALGVLSRKVEADLKRFKEFIEARRVPTGAWEGSIRGGEVR